MNLRSPELKSPPPRTMANRNVLRITTAEILEYQVPHTKERITYDYYVDANDLKTEYILCDLCGRSVRLGGSRGHRVWSYLERHRQTPACLDKQRANQRAKALEEERRVRAWNHMSTSHVDEDTQELLQCPPELLEVVRVRKYEEALIGIGIDHTEEFRGTYGILPTSDPPSEGAPLEEPHQTESLVPDMNLQLLAPGFSFMDSGMDERRKRSHSGLSVSSVVSSRQPPPSKYVRLED
ncbi:hypothetical protein NMY22_g16938 [Coprinellus aureogranulatus]|nr:hypothetical protein NMY22_g16938 [Coprinellus aureogranulatus]